MSSGSSSGRTVAAATRSASSWTGRAFPRSGDSPLPSRSASPRRSSSTTRPRGIVRVRSFPTDFLILEDEATGAAAVRLGAILGRPITIRQGVGSEILVRPQPDGTVEIGGRVERVETREYSLPQ